MAPAAQKKAGKAAAAPANKAAKKAIPAAVAQSPNTARASAAASPAAKKAKTADAGSKKGGKKADLIPKATVASPAPADRKRKQSDEAAMTEKKTKTPAAAPTTTTATAASTKAAAAGGGGGKKEAKRPRADSMASTAAPAAPAAKAKKQTAQEAAVAALEAAAKEAAAKRAAAAGKGGVSKPNAKNVKGLAGANIKLQAADHHHDGGSVSSVATDELAENSVAIQALQSQVIGRVKDMAAKREQSGQQNQQQGRLTGRKRSSDEDEIDELLGKVLYVGRVPHGFFEEEMKGFFSQFGVVENVYLSKNKKGKSKNFGFVHFAEADVAEIVADSMNNQLVMGRMLKVQILPRERLHANMFPEKPFANISFRRNAIVAREADRDASHVRARCTRLVKKQEKLVEELKTKGVSYEFPGYNKADLARSTHVHFDN